MVVLTYPYGLVGLYTHFNDTTVGVGANVNDANVVGHSGCTGCCGGPHVHVAMYSGNVQYDGGSTGQQAKAKALKPWVSHRDAIINRLPRAAFV